MSDASHYYDHDGEWKRRAAEDFPLWSSHSEREYARILKILQDLRRRGRLLDVGCGAGRFGQMAAAAGYEYLGVDDSREAIALGQKAYPDVALRVCDFVRDTLPGHDIVTAVNVLHCLVAAPERLAFLRHLREAAAHDGLIVITTMCSPAMDGFRTSKLPRSIASPDTIRSECEQAGLKIVLEDFRRCYGKALISNLTLVAKPSWR